ncbi:MAG: hypothetical protein QGH25_19830 [Candidatus Latescibacteria bacterium]|jgi:hypothetical protein|nr:hypothetical protein [Candidatus Latescibacterota bacterium]
MASEEVLVTAPLVVLLYDRIFRTLSFAQALGQHRGLYPGLACTWLILAALMWSAPHGTSVGFFGAMGVWEYALNQCMVIFDCLGKVFWPHPLVPARNLAVVLYSHSRMTAMASSGCS